MARYFVGNGTNWSSTSSWATSTGGASGAAVPTSTDDVFLDGNSPGSLTLDTTGNCQSITCTGFTHTFTISSQTLNIGSSSGGAMTLVSGMTLTSNSSSTIAFVSTSNNGGSGWAITTAGNNLPSTTYNGAGGAWTLQDTVGASGAPTLAVLQGTLNVNGQTYFMNSFISSGTSTRSVSGTGTLKIGGTGGSNFMNIASVTGLTWSFTGTIVLSGSPYSSLQNVIHVPSTMTLTTVTYNGSGQFQLCDSAITIGTLTLTGSANKTDVCALGASITVSTALNINGNSVTNRILVESATPGTATTITSNGTNTISNADFQDITGAGTASWNLAAITGNSGDCGGNSGITFTTAAAQTWSGTVSSNWSTNAWTSRVPLPQDNVTISSAFSASQTITLDMPRLGANINFTGTTGSPGWNATTQVTCFGSYTSVTGIARSSSSANYITFAGRSTETITSAGFFFPSVFVVAPGGTYTLQDAFSTNNNGMVVTAGTFTANGQNVSVATFGTSGSITRAINMGSGTWTMSGVTGSVWGIGATTGLTFNTNTSTLTFTGTSGTPTITTANQALNIVTFNGAGGSWQLLDANTMGAVTLTAGTLNTNGQTCTWSTFASNNSNTRTLTLGASAITLSGTGASWSCGTTTGLTVSSNTATVTQSGTGTLFRGPINWNGLSVVNTGTGQCGSDSAGTLTLANYTRTGNANVTDQFLLGGTGGALNLTVTGTLSIAGNSVTNRLLVEAYLPGVASTLTCNGTNAISNADFMDITGAGSASWNLASITGNSGDCGGNSGITFTTSAAQTWSGTSGGNWSANAWTSRVPLPQDDVTISSAFSASQTVVSNMPRLGRSVTWSGATGSPTWSFNLQVSNFGSITLISGMTFNPNGNALIMCGRSSYTLTSATKTFANGFQVIAPNGTVTLQDNLTVSPATQFFNVLAGTFNANNQSVTTGFFTSAPTGSATRAVTMGSGTWTINGTTSNVWSVSATGMTLTPGTSTLTFAGTSGTPGITTSNVTLGTVTFNGVGGSWTLNDTNTMGAVTLTNGTLNTNGQTCNWTSFSSSNSNTRTLTLGASAIAISGSGTAWTASTTGGLTFTPGTSVVTLNGANAGINVGTNAHTFAGLVLSGSGTAFVTESGAGTITCSAFTRTGTATTTDTFAVSGGSLTASTTLTLSGNSVTNRLLVQGGTLGTASTITSNGTNAISNTDFEDIAAAGSASWNLSAITGKSGDCGGNSGITFTSAQSNYYQTSGADTFSDTAKWFLATNGAGGAGRVPLPQDTGIFDSNSGGHVITMDMPRIGAIQASSGSNGLGFSSLGVSIFGSMTLGGSTVMSSAQAITMASRSASSITSGGVVFTSAVTINTLTATVTLADNFSGTSMTLATGTLTASANVALSGTFFLTGTGTRTLNMGSGTWTLSGTATVWNSGTTTGLTFNGSSATIAVTDTSGSVKTFQPGAASLSYGTLTFTGSSAGTLFLSGGATTFQGISVSGGAKTLELFSGSTFTIASAAGWQVNGTSLNLVTINASTPGSAATISIASGAVSSNYLSLKDNTATGGATFVAHYSTIVSNVSGWTLPNAWYWVSGAGTWNNSTTTNWAASSGGSGSAGVPAATDDVAFDSNSGTGTVTIAATAVCNNMAATGFTGTFGGSSGPTISASMTLGSGNVMSNTGTWTFVSTTSGNTLTTGGLTMPTVTFNGVGGTWTLNDTNTMGVVTLTNGTLNTNGKTCNWSSFNSNNSNTRALTMGASTINLTATSGTIWNLATTAITVTPGTSTIAWSASGTVTFSGATLTYNNLTVTPSAATSFQVGGSSTFNNLTFTGPAVNSTTLFNSGSITVNGVFTVNGNSTTNRVLFTNNTEGVQSLLTLNGTASVSNLDIQDTKINGTGSPVNWAAITGLCGDGGNNLGITTTTAQTNYWVGNGGSWTTLNQWASSSGGTAGSGRVPLPQDSVIFDANSISSASQTVTINMQRMGGSIDTSAVTNAPSFVTSGTIDFYGSWTMNATATYTSVSLNSRGYGSYTWGGTTRQITSLNVNRNGGTITLNVFLNCSGGFGVNAGTFNANGFAVSCGAFTVISNTLITRTITMGSGAWTIFGAATAVWSVGASGVTLNTTGQVTSFTGTSGTSTITTGGITMPDVIFNGVGGTWQLNDTNTMGNVTLTNGTLNTNGQTCSWTTFSSSNSNTRVMTFGSSSITVTAGGTSWNCSTVTSLTISANTATVTLNGASAAFSGAKNWNGLTVNFTGSGTALLSATTGIFANLTRTGTATKGDIFQISGSCTVSSVITLNGNSTTNRILVQSNFLGTTATITCNGSISASNVDFEDITGAGSASWSLAAITGLSGDCGGNSGITLTSSTTNYRVGSGGNWSDVTHWASSSGGSGSSGRVPLPQDTVNVDSNASGSVACDMPRLGGSLNFTSFTGAWNVNNATGSNFIFGNLTFGSGMSVGGGTQITPSGRSSYTITHNGITTTGPYFVQAPGGTYTLADNLNCTSGNPLTLIMGTLTASANVTTNSFSSTGTLTRTLNMGSGTWSNTMVITGGFWTVSGSGVTINPSTSIIALTGAASVSRTFTGGGFTYGTLQYNVASSTGALIIAGANTFASLIVGSGRTLTLPASTTTTISSAAGWQVDGANSSLTTLNSSGTPGTQATVSCASGTVTADYLSIQDSAATGGATWYAGNNSTNVSDNTGWIFGTAGSGFWGAQT